MVLCSFIVLFLGACLGIFLFDKIGVCALLFCKYAYKITTKSFWERNLKC